MLVDRLLKGVLAQIPEAVLERLAFVDIQHRPEPTAADVERGAGPKHRGYFFGHCVERSDDREVELPDEEPPRGTIVIFTKRIQPFTVHGLAVVVLHEIGHALGYDHDVIVDELGLG